jgi:hypothetical protein
MYLPVSYVIPYNSVMRIECYNSTQLHSLYQDTKSDCGNISRGGIILVRWGGGVGLGDTPIREVEIRGGVASLVFEVKCFEYSFYGNVPISGYNG